MKWLRFRDREARFEPLFEEHTDARPTDEPGRRRGEDAEADRRVLLRRRFALLALCIWFITGTVVALFGKGGSVELWHLHRQHGRVQHEVLAQEARLVELERQLHALKNEPMARERIAREELGLALPGEVDFLLPREDDGAFGGEGGPR